MRGRGWTGRTVGPAVFLAQVPVVLLNGLVSLVLLPVSLLLSLRMVGF